MTHELARDGIECRLIDKAPHRAMESRAIAIHSRTVETFELMGLADDFLGAGHRIAGVNVYGEHGRIAHAAFGMLETRYPFVLGVPQDETERIFEERLAQLGVRVERNTELVSLAQHESSVVGPEALPLTLPRYAETVLAAHRVAPPGVAGSDFIDCEGGVAKRYGSSPAAYLIRPDGYVGFRCDGRTVSANLPHYLAKLFSSAGPG
jgi:hypothetical protein